MVSVFKANITFVNIALRLIKYRQKYSAFRRFVFAFSFFAAIFMGSFCIFSLFCRGNSFASVHMVVKV